MATFGKVYAGPGGSWGTRSISGGFGPSSTNGVSVVAMESVLPVNALVSKLSFHGNNSDVDSWIRMALVRFVAGAPTVVVGGWTVERAMPASSPNQDWDMPYAAPISVPAGNYGFAWICYQNVVNPGPYAGVVVDFQATGSGGWYAIGGVEYDAPPTDFSGASLQAVENFTALATYVADTGSNPTRSMMGAGT